LAIELGVQMFSCSVCHRTCIHRISLGTTCNNEFLQLRPHFALFRSYPPYNRNMLHIVKKQAQHQDSNYRFVNVRCSSLAALRASITSLLRSDQTEQTPVRVGTSAENLVRVISVSVRRNLRFKICGLESVRVGTSPKTWYV
jgi:hypothetical protein